jgi:hypothetical protein
MYWLYEHLTFTIEYYLSKLKSYRRHKGGTWHRVFPKQYPYMGYWVQKEGLLPNEVIFETEIYN